MSAGTSYCAFLRGINVGRINLKMEDVRKVFSDLGLENVQTVLATGNVIFESSFEKDNLKYKIEEALSKTFIYEAYIFLRTSTEIKSMVDNCPFDSLKDAHIYIFVCDNEICKILEERFSTCSKMKDEEGKVVGSSFYWKIAKGNTLESEFGKVIGEKVLKSKITSRNKNTFDKIIQKLYL